ncbi:MAG: hypothetical protein QOI73_846, partial [Solirubrobacteraceae bacterium]|nr:hypothetical protein [Solirubrobacteraceae bacterium]
MGAAATSAWLSYRAALKTTLESPAVLGQLPSPPSATPLDDAIEEALQATAELEAACMSERELREVRPDQSEEQLLAGATIDFMLAAELAVLDAPAGLLLGNDPILPEGTRRGLWRSAVALADAAFEVRGGGGPNIELVAPILPRPTPPAPARPKPDSDMLLPE